MFDSSKQLDNAIREVLSAVLNSDQLNTLLEDDTYRHAMKECSIRGFVTGINHFKSEAGDILISVSDPQITDLGEQFLKSE